MNYQQTELGKITSTAQFIASDTLPDPDNCWLKKEKWFWCNEEAYKKWKTEQKE